MAVSEQKVDFRRNLFASGFGKNGEIVGEEGQIVEDGVDLGPVDGSAGRGQLAYDALSDVIPGVNFSNTF